MTENPDWYRAWTLVGGRVDVSTATRPDLLLGDLHLVVVDHEDGRMEFTEDEAFNLIGALSMAIMRARRARHEGALRARAGDEG